MPEDERNPEPFDKWDVDPISEIISIKDRLKKPRENHWLAERMGTWITQQRGYICYHQKHRQRLAKPPLMSEPDEQSIPLSGQPTTIFTTFYDQTALSSHHSKETRTRPRRALESQSCPMLRQHPLKLEPDGESRNSPTCSLMVCISAMMLISNGHIAVRFHGSRIKTGGSTFSSSRLTLAASYDQNSADR